MLSVSANLLPRVSIDESLINSLASLLSIAEFLEFKQIGVYRHLMMKMMVNGT